MITAKWKLPRLLALCLILIGLLACNLFQAGPVSSGLSTPVSAPAINLPTATTVILPVPPIQTAEPPLYQRVSLTASDIKEDSEAPLYTLGGSIPVLQGSDDLRVTRFNQQTAALVQAQLDNTRGFLLQLTPIPELGGMGSFYSVKFRVLSPPGNLISLIFDAEGYTEGAAHPYHFSQTFTYDLEAGQEISLDQLFLPGADYLKILADYSAAELSKRDIAFDMFSAGAEPIPDNYRNWNITADGLLITFDEYQVAPYAAGPQVVTVPYAILSGLINPQGPLAAFLAP